MEQYIDVVTVPIITTTVYWIMNLIKYTTNFKEKTLRYIPLMAVVCGCLCGLCIFYATPNLLTTDNAFVAMVIGGASGLSATGFNQIIKQMNKNNS